MRRGLFLKTGLAEVIVDLVSRMKENMAMHVVENISEKQEALIRSLDDEPKSYELGFLEQLTVRSRSWPEVPIIIKLILCANAVEMHSDRVSRFSIKLNEKILFKAQVKGINLLECVKRALDQHFGRFRRYAAVLVYVPKTDRKGLYAEVVVGHEGGASFGGISSFGIVRSNPLIAECVSVKGRMGKQSGDRWLSDNYGVASQFLLDALGKANHTRRRLECYMSLHRKSHISKIAITPQRSIIEHSLSSVGSRKLADTYMHDDLLILSDGSLQAGADLWRDIHSDLVNVHHEKMLAAFLNGL